LGSREWPGALSPSRALRSTTFLPISVRSGVCVSSRKVVRLPEL